MREIAIYFGRLGRIKKIYYSGPEGWGYTRYYGYFVTKVYSKNVEGKFIEEYLYSEEENLISIDFKKALEDNDLKLLKTYIRLINDTLDFEGVGLDEQKFISYICDISGMTIEKYTEIMDYGSTDGECYGSAYDGWPADYLPEYPSGEGEYQTPICTGFYDTTMEEMISYIGILKGKGFEFEVLYGNYLSEREVLDEYGWMGTDGYMYLIMYYWDRKVVIEHSTMLRDFRMVEDFRNLKEAHERWAAKLLSKFDEIKEEWNN